VAQRHEVLARAVGKGLDRRFEQKFVDLELFDVVEDAGADG